MGREEDREKESETPHQSCNRGGSTMSASRLYWQRILENILCLRIERKRVCVCVCVCERERERERESVCVCVCVYM